MQADLGPVTFVGELRAWAFDFILQPHRSVRQHCKWFLVTMIMLLLFLYLATQMPAGGSMFPQLDRLARLVSQLGILFGILTTFFTSMRLSWRIRYENYLRGFRR